MCEFSTRIRAAAAYHAESILALPNVVGVGLARRRRQGRITEEPVVVTYVSHKVPLDALAPGERVQAALDAESGSVPTDVVDRGGFPADDGRPSIRGAASVDADKWGR